MIAVDDCLQQTEFPPNIDAIEAAFRVKDKAIVYAYAPHIYNPHGLVLHPFIIEHEKVHIRRQGADPGQWWKLYIEVPSFRYEEELVAHVREYECRRYGKDGKRYTKDALLLATARRLAATFYQYDKTVKQAYDDIVRRLPANHFL